MTSQMRKLSKSAFGGGGGGLVVPELEPPWGPPLPSARTVGTIARAMKPTKTRMGKYLLILCMASPLVNAAISLRRVYGPI